MIMKKTTFVVMVLFFFLALTANMVVGQIFQFSYQGGVKELVLYPGVSGNTVSPVKPGGGNAKQAAAFYAANPKWGNIALEMAQRSAIEEGRLQFSSLSEMVEVLSRKDLWSRWGIDTTNDSWSQEMLVFGSKGGEPALVSVPSKGFGYIVTIYGKPWIRLLCFNPFYVEEVKVVTVTDTVTKTISTLTPINKRVEPDADVAEEKVAFVPVTAPMEPVYQKPVGELEKIPQKADKVRNLWIIPVAAVGAAGITYGVVKLLDKESKPTPPVVPPNTGGPGSGGNNGGGPGSGGRFAKLLVKLCEKVQALQQ